MANPDHRHDPSESFAEVGSLELIFGPDGELLAGDRDLFHRLGIEEPSSGLHAADIAAAAGDGLEDLIAEALSAAPPAEVGSFTVTPCWTSSGPGRRLRVGVPSGGTVPDRLGSWTPNLAHQLRNHQTVVANALYSLAPPGQPEPPEEFRTGCLRLGAEGLKQAGTLLDAFTGLTIDDRAGGPIAPERLLEWAAVLLAPRVKQREARLRLEAATASCPHVDAARSSRLLGWVCALALDQLGRDDELELAIEVAGNDVRLRFHIAEGSSGSPGTFGPSVAARVRLLNPVPHDIDETGGWSTLPAAGGGAR